MFPTEIRTLGSGLCVAVATVANAVNSKVQPASSQCNIKCHYAYLCICTADVSIFIYTVCVRTHVGCTCIYVLQVYPGLLGLLGFHGTFWLYSGLGLVMAVHGARVIPDNRSEPAFHIE